MAQTDPTYRRSQVETLEQLHHLDRKALTTPMHALPEEPGMWLVMHAHEHYVGLVNGEFHCDCKGYYYGHECYHIRRLKYELEVYELPADVDDEAICDMFQEFTGPEDIPDDPLFTGRLDGTSSAGVTAQETQARPRAE